MPIIRESVIRFRVFDGIDLNIDARTVNPRAWKSLQNYYPKTRGRLVKRQGTTLFASSTKFDSASDGLGVRDPFTKIFVPASTITERTVRGIRGLIATPLIDADKDTIFGALSWVSPKISTKFTTAGGLHDALFFVDSNNDIVVMETLDGTIQAAGQQWQFATWPRSEDFRDGFSVTNVGRSGQPSQPSEKRVNSFFTRADGVITSGGLLLATNRVDPLIGIFQSSNSAPKAGPFIIKRGNGEFYIHKVQAIAKYAGSIVLGGGQIQGVIGALGSGNAGTLEQDLRNFVFFLDIDEQDKVGASSLAKIGETPEGEPITALGIVAAQTDTMGLRGQLAVFTAARVEIFDGPPPQTDVDISSEFRSPITSAAGCSAPDTVTQTPAGLMYLGTDWNVYLIRPSDRPRPVGRAIEPALRGLTIEQMNFASAVFDEGLYKLAVPTVGGANRADQQYWADLRSIRFGEYDHGVMWTGSHTSPDFYGPFITLTGFQDAREVFMGSSVEGKIWRVNAPNVNTDEGTVFLARAESAEIDGGDAHIDKDFIGLELGMSTDKLNTTVDLVVSSMSDESCAGDADQFTEPVDPCGPTWGNFDYNTAPAVGANFYSSGLAFELIKKRPANRLRGRMFKVTITEESNALTSISDFGLRLRAVRRRGT